MIDPLLVVLVSMALGLLLAGAALHKATAFGQFAAAVREYRLLPPFMVTPVALLLAVTEGAVAIAWFSAPLRSMAATVTAVLFAVYAAAIAINLGRGRVHVHCGCSLGGAAGSSPLLSWRLVLRNLVLIALALIPLLPVSGRTFAALDWATLGAALAALGLLYAGASQLSRNDAAISSWRDAA